MAAESITKARELIKSSSILVTALCRPQSMVTSEQKGPPTREPAHKRSAEEEEILEMMNLVRWDPFADLSTAGRPFFRHDFWAPQAMTMTRPGRFPIDLSETENDIEVRATLPGVELSDLDVSIKDDVLT